MRVQLVLAAAACAALALPAAAKVESSSASGFAVVYEADVPVAPDVAYTKFLDIGAWWSSDHTYSGDARNMTIDPKQGGCWCEKLPDGFVKHLEVVNAEPGKFLVLSGGLGPLQFMGVNGALTVSFAANDKGTHVTMHYAVGGYDPDGFKTMPANVDTVMGAGFNSYAAFAAK